MNSTSRAQIVTAVVATLGVMFLSSLCALQWIFVDACRDLGGRIAAARWTCVLDASSLSVTELDAPFLQVEAAALGLAAGLVAANVAKFLLRRSSAKPGVAADAARTLIHDCALHQRGAASMGATIGAAQQNANSLGLIPLLVQ